VIRRRHLAAPLALLSTACVSRPWTPSVSVAYWSEDVPPAVATRAPTPAEALRSWQLAASDPWAPFAKYTLLASLSGEPTLELPDVAALEVVRRARGAAVTLATQGLPADVAWFVDLRGAASVAFGSTLSHVASEPVSAVPTFHNWPAEEELIPAEETLAAMLTMPPRLPGAGGGRPVFLMDAWRLAFRTDEPDDDVVDNRYVLTPADLPDAAALRAQGISRIVYLVESLDDTAAEEDDLHEAFEAYQRAGLTIHLVDLDWASRRTPQEPLPRALAPRVLVVQHRVTLLSDPVFYTRARGGFGGVSTGPSPFRGRTLRGGG
jgi:hypothetical protein